MNYGIFFLHLIFIRFAYVHTFTGWIWNDLIGLARQWVAIWQNLFSLFPPWLISPSHSAVTPSPSACAHRVVWTQLHCTAQIAKDGIGGRWGRPSSSLLIPLTSGPWPWCLTWCEVRLTLTGSFAPLASQQLPGPPHAPTCSHIWLYSWNTQLTVLHGNHPAPHPPVGCSGLERLN